MAEVTTSRRAVLGATAAGAGLALVACSTAPPTSGGGSGPAPAGTTLGPTSDVPVGSAKIYTDQQVVVTQPTAGKFDGFSAVCPHQGCIVGSVEGATIVCPCHGSTFALDGSVVRGPAPRGLTPETVTAKSGQLTVG